MADRISLRTGVPVVWLLSPQGNTRRDHSRRGLTPSHRSRARLTAGELADWHHTRYTSDGTRWCLHTSSRLIAEMTRWLTSVPVVWLLSPQGTTRRDHSRRGLTPSRRRLHRSRARLTAGELADWHHTRYTSGGTRWCLHTSSRLIAER